MMLLKLESTARWKGFCIIRNFEHDEGGIFKKIRNKI